MPFPSLTELPTHLRQPAVRDLAWALLSPPLLADSPWPQRHPLRASSWSQHPEKLADWLMSLDADSHALQQWLSQHSVRRLGLYYERLWQFALHAAPDVEVLAANLPIRLYGHTLGELDMLLRDDEGVHHLELAIKLYLGQPHCSGADPAHWLGPGSHDRLDIKLTHLGQHQLPLSARAEALQRLAELDIQQPQAALWLAGYLFRPWRQAYAAPHGENPAHLRGRWLHRADWTHFAMQHPGHWQPLPRQAWLAPARIEEEHLWTCEQLSHWLAALPNDANAQLLVHLIEDPQQQCWREAERVFLVNDQWPAQATE